MEAFNFQFSLWALLLNHSIERKKKRLILMFFFFSGELSLLQQNVSRTILYFYMILLNKFKPIFLNGKLLAAIAICQFRVAAFF